MNDLTFDPQLSVAETLSREPRWAGVFLRNRTACVGCALARFCTLQDVAAAYDLRLPVLLDQLAQVLRSQPNTLHEERPNENTI